MFSIFKRLEKLEETVSDIYNKIDLICDHKYKNPVKETRNCSERKILFGCDFGLINSVKDFYYKECHKCGHISNITKTEYLNSTIKILNRELNRRNGDSK